MISNLTIKPLGLGKFALRWDSDQTPPTTFRIYRNGVLLAHTTARRYDVGTSPGEYPQYDVFDDATTEPAKVFPTRLEFERAPMAGADQYVAEQFRLGTWQPVARQVEDGAGVYDFQARKVEDGDTVLFRMRSIDPAGTQLDEVSLSRSALRNPEPPACTFSYSAGTGKITVTV